MSHDNIYYINIKPYIYDLTFDEMINRFLNSGILDTDPTLCRGQILESMKNYSYFYVDKSSDAQNVDRILSKQIIKHLHIFFDKTKKDNLNNKFNNKLTKNKKVFKNKTLKKKI
jgi:hypothetical protein